MNQRRIAVVTGARSEYGLLQNLLREINEDPHLQLQLMVTGMHLEKKFGLTFRQIEKDGFKIAAKIPMGLKGDRDEDIATASGQAVIGLSRAIARLSPDIIVVLGDRFEMLAAAMAATLMRIPLAHIHGGEVTEGSYDNLIRHAITKLAQLHFTAHEKNSQRIVRMGESPQRVFTVGAPGLDQLHQLKFLSLEALENELKFKINKHTALVTFHPVTMHKGAGAKQITQLLLAIKETGLDCIFTMPNADPENAIIRRKIQDFVKATKGKSMAVESLGSLKYLSLLKNVGMMIGNSSSGIIEAPSFQLPVVNIGDRQKGRLRARNVIDVDQEVKAIVAGINKARSQRFVQSLKGLKNIYGDGHSSLKIKNILKKVSLKSLQMKP